MEALKQKFRQGRHAEAIAECEALCRRRPDDRPLKRLCAMMHALVRNHARALELLLELRDPDHEDPDLLFNIGVCERELDRLDDAARTYALYTETFPDHPEGWASLAECRLQLKQYPEAVSLADRGIALDAALLQAWNVRAHGLKALRQYERALESYDRANRIQPTVEAWLHAGLTHLEMDNATEAIRCLDEAMRLSPDAVPLRIARGDARLRAGRLADAVDDYRAALKLEPPSDEALKKASTALLQADRAADAIALCRDTLRAHPDMLTAKLGLEWILSKLVPVWHVPMINERERNQAYHDGLQSVVAPDRLVFEIGTGSGLLAMMAAKLGAKQVVTCETVGLIADTAARIVARNGLQDRVRVLARSSHEVQVGRDLPERADILVHEIFSSELLGEHVLPAIEDAKRRLLKPDGVVLPSAASLMIALVGGEALGMNVHADASFGFDLRDFNAIHPKRRPLHRDDLELEFMSDDVEAFRFDFAARTTFPAERKSIHVKATRAGRCHGVIQWIRLEMGGTARFENHPSVRRPVSNWQHTFYGFDEPVELRAGDTVPIAAMHDRSRPWFERMAGPN